MGFPIMAHGYRCSLPLLLLFLQIVSTYHYIVCVVNVRLLNMFVCLCWYVM
uniref:Uncharacterized protein n=1 Tax=Triticum urartu TaxID=4572 RepID=A0A8R7PEE2_TRIUA